MMYFILGLFIGYFLFTIRPVMRFYRYRKDCERLSRELTKAHEEIKNLHSQSAVKDIRPAAPAAPKRESVDHAAYMPPAPKKDSIYGADPQDTWGLLWAKYPKSKESLTPAQQALVKYPYLDKNKVFYTPYGKSYHSVSWCYTIGSSFKSCSLQSAEGTGLKPCSKCVSNKQRESLEAFMEDPS